MGTCAFQSQLMQFLYFFFLNGKENTVTRMLHYPTRYIYAILYFRLIIDSKVAFLQLCNRLSLRLHSRLGAATAVCHFVQIGLSHSFNALQILNTRLLTCSKDLDNITGGEKG